MFSSEIKEPTKPKECSIKMKSGSIFSVPPSWQKNEYKGYVCVSAPEKDLSIYFLELPVTQSLESMAADAWKRVEPDFALKPAQQLSPAATDSWEKMCQIVYEVPTSESRMVIAIVRVFKEQAYVLLADGKMAGFHRRVSELTIMLESWKPVGFKEIQLGDHEAKDWNDDDVQSFEEFISNSMHKLAIPGVTVAIVRKDGKLIYSKGFGVKQIGSDENVTIDTPFMIGSITKPLTTLLMSILVDQKKLSWKTPITELLPDFSLGDSNLTHVLNIRHTVSASTGMPSGGHECLFNI